MPLCANCGGYQHVTEECPLASGSFVRKPVRLRAGRIKRLRTRTDSANDVAALRAVLLGVLDLLEDE